MLRQRAPAEPCSWGAVTIPCLHLLMLCRQKRGTHRAVSATTEDGGAIWRRKTMVVVGVVAAMRFAGAFSPYGCPERRFWLHGSL